MSQRFTSRVSPILHRWNRVATYLAVGGALAIIQMALTYIAGVNGDLDPGLASLMASAVTVPISFWAHKNTTYADVPRARFQATRFGITACSGIVIAAGVIKLVQLGGGPFWLGVLLGSALVPLGNYTVNTLWVFRTKGFISMDGKIH